MMINPPPLDTIPLSIPAQQVFESDKNFMRYTQRLLTAVEELSGGKCVPTAEGVPLYIETRTGLASMIKEELTSLGFNIFVRSAWLQEILHLGWGANPVLGIVYVGIPNLSVLTVDFLDQLERENKETALLGRAIIGGLCAVGPVTMIYDCCKNLVSDNYDEANDYHMSLLPTSLIEASRRNFNERVLLLESWDAGMRVVESAASSPLLTDVQRSWCAEIVDICMFFKNTGIPHFTDTEFFQPDRIRPLSEHFIIANDDDVLCSYRMDQQLDAEDHSDPDFIFSYDIYSAHDVRILSRMCSHINALGDLFKLAPQIWCGRMTE